jgi:hypothetical protein
VSLFALELDKASIKTNVELAGEFLVKQSRGIHFYIILSVFLNDFSRR